MSQTKIMVFLSPREADAMLQALGNSTSNEVVLDDLFSSDKTGVRACLRSEKKLRIAIHSAREAQALRKQKAKLRVEKIQKQFKSKN